MIQSITYTLDDTEDPETITKETHDIKMVFLMAHGHIVYAALPYEQDAPDLIRQGFMVSAMYVTEIVYTDGTTLTERDT